MSSPSLDSDCTRLANIVFSILAETRRPRSDTPWIAPFPAESCDLASSVLLVVFQDHGISGFHIVEGEFRYFGRTVRHHWLQRESNVVDITASQFSKLKLPDVICGSSSWHETISNRVLHDRTPDTERNEVSNWATLAEVRRRWPVPYP